MTGESIPTDENGVTYVVITEGSGPFDTAELLMCAPLSAGVREIGHPCRKPLKWPDVEYERFGDAQEAIDAREDLRTRERVWVPTSTDE